MKITLYDYCERRKNKALLEQWDYEKNENLSPEDISYGSKKKVWWRCSKGHSWQTAVYVRSGSGAGCPYCAGKNISPEESLAARYPELLRDWDWNKNLGVSPLEVFPASNKRIWWKCSKGHEWQTAVKSRTRGFGCPICTNRTVMVGVNDLVTTHPDAAAQWHPTKNGSLTPEMVTHGSAKKVWWRCNAGHEWNAVVYSLARGVGCPYCSGRQVIPGENDLASRFPEIAAEWHPTKNGALTPEMVAPQANRRSWWICALGHEYSAIIADRTNKQSGCPYCTGRKVLAGFNDLATVYPKIAAQWHPSMNGRLTAEMVTPGSSKKAWWQCDDGHVWHATINSRTGKKKTGCPVCAGKVNRSRSRRYDQILEKDAI